jgi:hypothetical protein
VLNHKQVTFHQVVQVLLDISLFRTMDSQRKTIEGRLKFVTRKPHLVLQGLAKLVTPYALKLVEKEMCRKKVKSYSIFQV